MSKIIKIANGQGFWGDSIDAPYNLVKHGEIEKSDNISDDITLEYLSDDESLMV